MPLADMPQVNKQHAVPQNIMDVEFKLVGDLTMRQFAYLMICGGIAYFVAVTVVGVFKWPLMIFFTLLGLGLAFVPIQERGLDEWVVNFIRAVYSPTQRVWKKAPSIPSAFLYENINVVKQELITLAPTSSRRKLEDYLKYQGGKITKRDPLDIPEEEYMLKVRAAFANEPVSVGVSTEPVTVDTFVSAPLMPQQTMEEEPPSVPQDDQQVDKTEDKSQTTVMSDAVSTPSLPDNVQSSKPTVTLAQPAPQREQPKIRLPKLRPFKQQPKTTTPFAPLTPDMHAGRRFTNLLPYANELVLPIRGEKVLRTSGEGENSAQDIQDKTVRLQQLLSQIKQNEFGKNTNDIRTESKFQQPQTVPSEQEVNKEAQEISQKLQSENERLNQEIEKLKTDLQVPAPNPQDVVSKEQLLERLEVQKEKTQSDYSKLKNQILELQNRLKEKEQPSPATPSAATPTYANIQPLTNQPNIISGIVKGPAGNVLEGILLIVKNEKSEPVRAFKTNSLGQFRLITPLSNGIYVVEVSPNNNNSLAFDIISLEAKGEIIPPLEIVGREAK